MILTKRQKRLQEAREEQNLRSFRAVEAASRGSTGAGRALVNHYVADLGKALQSWESGTEARAVLKAIGFQRSAVVILRTAVDHMARETPTSTFIMTLGRHLDSEYQLRSMPEAQRDGILWDNRGSTKGSLGKTVRNLAKSSDFTLAQVGTAGMVCLMRTCILLREELRIRRFLRPVPVIVADPEAEEYYQSAREALHYPGRFPSDEEVPGQPAFKFDSRVMPVVQELWDRKEPIEGLGIPEKISEDRYTRNIQIGRLRSERGRLRSILEVHAEMQDSNLWFPLEPDFRGRLYTRSGSLTYQGNDLARGCLRFAQAGLQSVSEVAAWAQQCYGFPISESTLREVGRNPLGSLQYLRKAAKPWQFLQACQEYADPEGTLIVHRDAVSSSMQHAAMITGDHALCRAALVEQNAYERVAECNLPTGVKGWLGPKQLRDLSKKVTMGALYGITPRTLNLEAYELLRGGPFEKPMSTSKKAIRVLQDSVGETFPALKDLVESFQGVGKASTGPISWKTPDGFEVVQDTPNSSTRQVRTYLFGTAYASSFRIDSGHSKRAAARSLCPNVIHSLDAQALRYVLEYADFPVAPVHDSFGVHPGNVHKLESLYRQALIAAHSGDVPGYTRGTSLIHPSDWRLLK